MVSPFWGIHKSSDVAAHPLKWNEWNDRCRERLVHFACVCRSRTPHCCHIHCPFLARSQLHTIYASLPQPSKSQMRFVLRVAIGTVIAAYSLVRLYVKWGSRLLFICNLMLNKLIAVLQSRDTSLEVCVCVTSSGWNDPVGTSELINRFLLRNLPPMQIAPILRWSCAFHLTICRVTQKEVSLQWREASNTEHSVYSAYRLILW